MAMNENNNTSIKWHRVVVMTILCLFGFSLITTVAAPDKKKKRQKTDERVYLKHADELTYDQWGAVPGAQILRGKVLYPCRIAIVVRQCLLLSGRKFGYGFRTCPL